MSVAHMMTKIMSYAKEEYKAILLTELSGRQKKTNKTKKVQELSFSCALISSKVTADLPSPNQSTLK